MKQDFSSQIAPGEFQKQYWQAAPSRQELQQVLDEYGQLFAALQVGMAKMDILLAYMVEHFKLDLKDVQAFAERMAGESQANAPAPEPEPPASGLIVEG